MDIQPGQTWEMYSRPDGRWVHVIVAKVQDAGELVKTKCSFQAGSVSVKLTFSEQNRCDDLGGWNGLL